jgi:hypothetical protein
MIGWLLLGIVLGAAGCYGALWYARWEAEHKNQPPDKPPDQ